MESELSSAHCTFTNELHACPPTNSVPSNAGCDRGRMRDNPILPALGSDVSPLSRRSVRWGWTPATRRSWQEHGGRKIGRSLFMFLPSVFLPALPVRGFLSRGERLTVGGAVALGTNLPSHCPFSCQRSLPGTSGRGCPAARAAAVLDAGAVHQRAAGSDLYFGHYCYATRIVPNSSAI